MTGYEMNRNNGHANLRPHPYKQNYRLLGNPESGRNTHTPGRAHELSVHYQMFSPENMHTMTLYRHNSLYLGIYAYICECKTIGK